MKIACEAVEDDKTLNLSEEQRKENKKELKKAEENVREVVRRLYRSIAVPSREGFKEIDLGIPTYGEARSLDQEVYEKLRSDGEILDKTAPLVIREKYLHVGIYLLLTTFPHRWRIDAMERAILVGAVDSNRSRH